MTRENWSYIAYALTAVAALVFLLTLVMLSRVKVAIACIKVCAACCFSTGTGRYSTHIKQELAGNLKSLSSCPAAAITACLLRSQHDGASKHHALI